MKLARDLSPLICAMVTAAALLGASGPAAAIEMSVYVSPPHQTNNGATVSLGHSVSASTNMNRLVAGGTFNTACNDPKILPLTGQRTSSSEGLTGPRAVIVTMPDGVPSLRTMPGFSAVTFGTEVSCTYNWTARAVEATYSIGTGGVGVVIGGGERTDGGTVPFTMLRADSPSRGCVRD